MAKGISRTETYANRIIGYLYSKNIEADYADSWEEYTYDLIRLIPKNTSFSQFKALSDDLQLELRLSHPPQFEITQGCIQIKIDTRYFDTDKQPNKPLKMQLVKDEWLPEIAAKIIHGKADGETQSGKSTFVSNLSALLSVAYPDAEFVKIDPKYPLSLDWDAELAEWERKPKYPGIKQALTGLQELANEIEQRLIFVTEDVTEGRRPRKFAKKVYLVDEIDWIVLEYGKEAIDKLQVGLKVGAALDVIVIYFGQTPRCSKLKMTKDDFRNSTNISLGSNIPDAISTYVFDDSYGRELLDLYWREINTGNIYVALVSQKGQKPFLAQLPAPNQYKPVKKPESPNDWSSGFLERSQVTDSEVLLMIQDGKTDSQIVKALWGIVPSRSEDYKNAIKHVERLRLESWFYIGYRFSTSVKLILPGYFIYNWLLTYLELVSYTITS